MGAERLRPGEKSLRPEIERRFRVILIPDEILNLFPFGLHSHINQGYLPNGDRLRKETFSDGGTYSSITKKMQIPNSLLGKMEDQEGLTRNDFEALWKQTEGVRVEKNRHRIKVDNVVIELDQLIGGEWNGVVIAEIEFKSEEEANAFNPPVWLLNAPEATHEISTRKIAKGLVKPDWAPIVLPAGVVMSTA